MNHRDTRHGAFSTTEFVVLVVTGIATLWMAVLADMGASLIVIANGMRAPRP